MLYLSKLKHNPFFGAGSPNASTNLPTAYVGRKYIDNNTGIIYRCTDATPNANVWDSTEDATTLDGLDSTQFIRSDVDDTASGNYTFSGNNTFQGSVTVSNNDPAITLHDVDDGMVWDTRVSNDLYELYMNVISPSSSTLALQINGATSNGYLFGNKILTTADETSELQKITEGGNTGWALLGRNPSHYGNIGNYAIDLSYNGSTSNTRGATGVTAFASGVSTTASGSHSMAMGLVTTANGDNSVALGRDTTVNGNNALVAGRNTTAIGHQALATGLNTSANGDQSLVSGDSSTAGGVNSFASGYNTTASGDNSIASGYTTTASGDRSFSVGDSTVSSGDNSSAFGHNTVASGMDSVAFNLLSQASGGQSVASGNNTRAVGSTSFASGADSHANGIMSTAMGNGTHADGHSSMSVNAGTTATGNNSFASGSNTEARRENSMVCGMYNLALTDSMFEVGIGTSGTHNNALTVYADGKIRAPRLTTALINNNRSLTTKEYVDNVVAGAGYVLKTGDTMTGLLTLTGSAPQIKLNDSDANAHDYWLHANSNNFYVLVDRDNNGSWDGAHPLDLDSGANKGYCFGNEIITTGNLGLADGRFVNKTGDTMTGVLDVSAGLSQDGHVVLNGSDTWLRTTGATGWHSDTYGGGMYMTDSTWVRTYANKSLYVGGGNIATSGWVSVGLSSNLLGAKSIVLGDTDTGFRQNGDGVIGHYANSSLVFDTTTGGINMKSNKVLNHNSSDSYDKLRVYNSNSYTIGMHSGMSYGALNDWAMTFTMNNNSNRGWVWRHDAMSQSQGAMSLTTNGTLTIKNVDVSGGRSWNNAYNYGNVYNTLAISFSIRNNFYMRATGTLTLVAPGNEQPGQSGTIMIERNSQTILVSGNWHTDVDAKPIGSMGGTYIAISYYIRATDYVVYSAQEIA